MQIEPFALERYFARHEFTAPFLLSASDCETFSLEELLALASPEIRFLWDALRLGYTETLGHPRLRTAIAGLYETVSPGGIFVAAPEEAVFLFMQSMLGPGDHAVVITPAYQSLYAVARGAGSEVTRVDLCPEPQGWRLDTGRLARSFNQRTRLLVVNFPHNPTGYLPSRAEFDEVVGMARDRGVYVFGDEMYRFLEHDGAERLPAVCDVYEKGISLSGVSKPFGLAGLRIGWLATRETALLDRWVRLKDYTTICSSAPSEVLGMVALDARETILDRNRAIVRNNLAAAKTFFPAYPDRFRWIDPRGGSVAFPVWTGPGAVEEFCRRSVEQCGVVIVPGSLFEYPGNHFRVGLGRRNFCDALERVRRVL